jgi:Zn-dependent protease with chaperone function
VKSLVKALAVVLAVPAICAALALTSRSELDARWQATLRRPFLSRGQMPDERVIARYALGVRCADPWTAAGTRPCRPYNLFTSMADAAAVTAAVGVAFLAAIGAVGAACRSRRARLSHVLRLAVYGIVGGLVVLVLVHGALGVAGVFLLGEVIQRWPVTMVLVLAAATAGATLSMIQLALAVTSHESPSVVARLLSPEDYPGLAAWVGEIAGAVGARVPEHTLAGLRPGVFVSDDAVVHLDGRVDRRTLYFALPLARILSVEELRGLVAHELAHFREGQAEENTRLVRFHAGVKRSVRRLADRALGIRAVTALPALSILSVAMDGFEPAVASAQRDREFAADRAAADLVGSRTLAAALVKAHAFTPGWDAVSAAMDRAVMAGAQYVNASALFAQVTSASAGPERLVGAGALSLPHPTDVHPSVADRLKALGVVPGDVTAAALATQPPHPAVVLVEGYETIERDLSEVEHRIAASVWARPEDDEVSRATA